MESSKQQFESAKATKTENKFDSELTVSKKLHPEDIVIGDAVAVSETVYQYISFSWCGVDTTRLPPEEVVKVPCLSHDASPLIVQSVCLPYVLCKKFDGKHLIVDVRQNQLVRLNKAFARLARAALKLNDDDDKTSRKSKDKKRKRKKRSK